MFAESKGRADEKELSPAQLLNQSRGRDGMHRSSLYVHLNLVSKLYKNNPMHGQALIGGLRVANIAGKINFLMPADVQKGFNFTQGLAVMAQQMGLHANAEIWWIGGDLKGYFSVAQSEKAVDCLESFIDSEFVSNGALRSDRVLISEYAGPENAEGSAYSGIRCVGKLIERRPELLSCFLPYAVIDGGAPEWFQSIGAIAHARANFMYLVCGERTGESDPWDSNGLAKNAFILEGGSRVLGYIFEVIAQDGQVIALHGFREKSKPFMSASKFIGALQTYLNQNPKASFDDVMVFYNQYITKHPAFDPSASDAHTKTYFINKAWELFKKERLVEKLKSNVHVYSAEQWLGRGQVLDVGHAIGFEP